MGSAVVAVGLPRPGGRLGPTVGRVVLAVECMGLVGSIVVVAVGSSMELGYSLGLEQVGVELVATGVVAMGGLGIVGVVAAAGPCMGLEMERRSCTSCIVVVGLVGTRIGLSCIVELGPGS